MRCKACNNPLDGTDEELCTKCLIEAFKYVGKEIVINNIQKDSIIEKLHYEDS